MKKRIALLVMAALFVLTVGVAAKDYQFVGGVTYTTIDLKDLNDAIDGYNDILKGEYESYIGSGEDATVNYLDNLDNSIGFFIGLQSPINDKFKLGTQYEKYSLNTEGSLKSSHSSPGSFEDNFQESSSFDLDINGVVVTSDYKVNNSLSLTAGIGYYFGKLNEELYSKDEYTDYIDSSNSYVHKYDDISKIDLNGIGFKVGATYSHKVKENLSLVGSVNYRSLTLKNKDDKDKKLPAGGFEVSGGINYSF